MNEIEEYFYNSFFSYAKKIITLEYEMGKSLIKTMDKDGEKVLVVKNYYDFKDDPYDGIIELDPQYRVEKYTLDFLASARIRELRYYLGIEIDGHQWYEKTKDQASRDKKRDRNLLLAGYPLLRYTGREIMTKTEDCILEIINYFRERYLMNGIFGLRK